MAPIVEYFDPRQKLPPLRIPDWLTTLAATATRAAIEALPDSMRRNLAEALVPVRLAPPGASVAEQFEHYKAIIEARGFSLDPVHPTVLAIRGMASDGTVHPTTSAARYDDTLVVLKRDANGNVEVTTFAGSTHPGQRSSTASPDVTRDGLGDVGMINAGEYRIEPRGEHAGAAAWDVRTAAGSHDLAGVRDTDHDGQFSAAERAASAGRGDTLSGVLIHQGGADNPWSIGCINLSQNQDVYPQFIQTVGGDQASMKLIVVDANS